MAEGLHAHHRDRLRRRFSKEGGASFEDHNLLELLLFYAIPRRDTNDLAHLLLNRFGSVAGVLSAKRDALCTVPGIGENTAILLELVFELCRRSNAETVQDIGKMDTPEKISSYFLTMYSGIHEEQVYMMMLDEKQKMIDCVHVGDGDINVAAFHMRKLVGRALESHAASVVIAHNHLNTIAIPSSTDIDTTAQILAAFDLVGIRVVEHLLIAGKACMPIIQNSLVFER